MAMMREQTTFGLLSDMDVGDDAHAHTHTHRETRGDARTASVGGRRVWQRVSLPVIVCQSRRRVICSALLPHSRRVLVKS